jgi:hypothetical protein
LNLLKPRLNTHEEDSWEELETVDIGGGAGSLRWLVWVCMQVLSFFVAMMCFVLAMWYTILVLLFFPVPQPRIDDNSKATLAEECPRVTVNPQPSLFDACGSKIPVEALTTVPLDHSIIEDIDPKTWAVSAAPRRIVDPPNPNAPPEIPIAERFRLAYVEREARLAPKRAKRERQQQRRAGRDYVMNDINARSIALAAQATRNLHKS